MYAEFVACYEATGQVNYLKKFIPGLKVVDDIYRLLKLYCDNNPAVQYVHNNKSSGAAKPGQNTRYPLPIPELPEPGPELSEPEVPDTKFG